MDRIIAVTFAVLLTALFIELRTREPDAPGPPSTRNAAVAAPPAVAAAGPAKRNAVPDRARTAAHARRNVPERARREPASAPEPAPGSVLPVGLDRSEPEERRRLAPAVFLAARRLSPEVRSQVDWDYVQDVWDGYVSGFPDERRAGLSAAMIALLRPHPEGPWVEAGAAPPLILAYPEPQRNAPDYQALEPPPWPLCIRTGSCRQDPASTPPSGA